MRTRSPLEIGALVVSFFAPNMYHGLYSDCGMPRKLGVFYCSLSGSNGSKDAWKLSLDSLSTIQNLIQL